ncbi:hypothetical protein C9374_011048 [Naegleria lovaniensis]|uniref:Uncharacterized protein n=1 Tax=Naegleria lovaniensis TaxID=51637 RepID=A0AA88KFM6_NAELO|nr:uncharacterized protein C9374_011048 [Naegleria lovaniensis]KAG2374211.1 hypothetical protein C9374_011048 [Naegleria lovaniensis]
MVRSIPQHDVYTCGENSYGQLFSSSNSHAIPSREFVLNHGLKETLKDQKFITLIDAGDDFTAFVTHDNCLYMSGFNVDNLFGLPVTEDHMRLHNHRYNNNYYYTNNFSTSTFIVDSPTQVPVKYFKNEEITHLSCGSNHVCVVTNRENIYTFGLIQSETKCVKLSHDKHFDSTYLKNLKDQRNLVTLIGSGLNYTIMVVNSTDIYIMTRKHLAENQHPYYYFSGQAASQQDTFPYEKGKFTYLNTKCKALEGTNIRYLACGRSHFVVVNDQNEIYGLGSNAEGQLAQKIGTDKFHEKFCKISMPTQDIITGVECGYLYTIVITGSRIYAVGDNQYGYTIGDGQLGIRAPCHEGYGMSVYNQSQQTVVRQFVLLDYKFDKKISHVLCGRGTSIIVTQTGFNEMQFKQKLLLVQSHYCKFTDISIIPNEKSLR